MLTSATHGVAYCDTTAAHQNSTQRAGKHMQRAKAKKKQKKSPKQLQKLKINCKRMSKPNITPPSGVWCPHHTEVHNKADGGSNFRSAAGQRWITKPHKSCTLSTCKKGIQNILTVCQMALRFPRRLLDGVTFPLD